MAVDSLHPEIEAARKDWEIMRDVVAGQRRIHKRGATYLPILEEQTDKEYQAYKSRAVFYNATGRTIAAMVGLLTRKNPVATFPASLADITANLDGRGGTLDDVAVEIAEEVCAVGYVGALVDFPQTVDNRVVTIAEARAENRRPFVTVYTAEQILDFDQATVGAQTVLSQVRLYETIDAPDPDDEFGRVAVERIRVLALVGGVYVVRIFIKDENGKYIEDGEPVVPLMSGRPLAYIPFVFVGAHDQKPRPDKPPLLDLANLNLSHYRTTADLEHGAHFTALPTPVISGVSDDGENQSYRIGSSAAWVFADKDVKAEFLEFRGQGLSALRDLAKDKEERMAAIGARAIAPEKRAAEAAETLTIRSASENAVLSAISRSVSVAVERLLLIVRDWAGGASGEVAYALNRDFTSTVMSAQDLTALLQAWQSGAISKETLFENLKAGEIIQGDRTFEEEEDRIEDEGLPAGDFPPEPVAAE